MNFKIKHKIPGRIRVHMGQSRMSFDQADTLQYFLEAIMPTCHETVTIKAKGGASGRLHGKVTGKEVAEALAALAGAPIDKKKIELETKDIKDAGVFNGKVRLYVGVVASFKIQVEVEQA